MKRLHRRRGVLSSKAEQLRQKAAMDGLREIAALYGIHPEADTLKDLDLIAREHERRSEAHQAVAGLIRETIAAAHGATLQPPPFGPEKT